MSKADAGEQANKFFIDRGEYSLRLAETHLKDREKDKAKKLYMDAFNYFMKAYKSTTDAIKKEELKAKLMEVKQKGESCG